jgi:hypothetical protein
MNLYFKNKIKFEQHFCTVLGGIKGQKIFRGKKTLGAI